MSAFTVSSEHIAVLVHAGLWSPLRPLTWAVPTPDGELPIDGNAYNGIIPGWRPFSRARQLTAASADAVGQMLLDQNIASVNDAYNDDDLAIYTHQRPRSIHRQPVEILKAISCYRYQADATDNWSTSEAFHFCTVLETATIEKLPGWENAAWAIGHDTPILTEQQARHRPTLTAAGGSPTSAKTAPRPPLAARPPPKGMHTPSCPPKHG